MSNNMHKVFFNGTVAKDPELQYLQTGQPKLTLRVVVNEWERDNREEKGGREIATWYQVEVWGKPAESLNQLLAKGDMVAVSGTPRYRLYKRNQPDANGMEYGLGATVKFADVALAGRRKAQGDFHSAPAENGNENGMPEDAPIASDEDEVF